MPFSSKGKPLEQRSYSAPSREMLKRLNGEAR
jgi:hypothetical protein